MNEKIKCANCGKEIIGHNYGLSRKDNKTRLCSTCESREAMQEAEEKGLI